MFKRKTRRLGDLHVVRRAGRRQRSDLLQLRPAQSRPVGIRRRRCARLGNDLGFVNIVTGGTIILYVLSLILSRQGLQIMLEPSIQITYLLGASGAYPVFGQGRWWTVLTAGWLHGGILHIFFNVMWIRQLGPEIAEPVRRRPHGHHLHRRRHRRVRAEHRCWACCRFRSSGRRLTVGASASIFGFLGALVHYGRRTGSSHVGQAGLQYALFMGIMGFVVPRRRQRRAPWRIHRRLSRVADPRSAEARTHRSPRHRRRLPCRHASSRSSGR